MRKIFLSILLLCSIATYAQEVTSGNGGQLIKNHSFEEEAKPIRNRRFGPNGEGELFGGYLPSGIIPGWIGANSEGAVSQMETTTKKLLNKEQCQSLCWSITEATPTSPAAIANVGHNGIEAIKGNKYTLTFWVRADKRYKGRLHVGLQSKLSDGTWYAQTIVKGKIKKRWKKYSVTFVAEGDAENARFVITADTPGTLYIDEVSLYSPIATKR